MKAILNLLSRKALRRIKAFIEGYRNPSLSGISADAIVCLGGGHPHRARAAAVVHNLTGLHVIVTGLPNEVENMRGELIRQGVHASAIKDEPRAVDTPSNAYCVSEMLSRQARIILITHRFHMLRAVWLFQWFGMHPTPWVADANPSYSGERLRKEARYALTNKLACWFRMVP